MKNDIADILFKYTTGEATLEETNDALKEAEAGFNLEPGRNEITPDEMALTKRWVVAIAGGDDLLANKPVLQRAVKMRSPYVDVLSLLQLRALRVLRSDSPDGAGSDWEHLLLLSVSGVSAGLQNTG